MKKLNNFKTKISLSTRRQLMIASAGAMVLMAIPGCKRSAVEEVAKGGSAAGSKKLILTQSSDIQIGSFMAQNNPNFAFLRTVFNTLTEYDVKTMTPNPSLAKSWKISDDQKTITLELRDDIVYHDGSKFTSADVLAAIAHVQKDTTASQLKHNAKIVTASAPTENQVVLTLAHAVSNIFDMFEMIVIPQKDSYEKMQSGAAFVGTGPFKVDSYKQGQSISFSAHDKYFNGRPKIDNFEIQIVAEASSRVASLKTGASHVSMDLPPLDITNILKDPNIINIDVETWDSAMYVGSNVTITPLDKKEVRQAIAWSIDRESIVKKAMSGMGQVSSLPWVKSSPAYDATKDGKYSYNPTKAKQLIASSGAKGKEVKIHFQGAQAGFASVAEIVQANINAIGLKAVLVPMQPADFTKGLFGEGLPGLFVNGHGFGHMQPATLLKGAFPFNSDKNASRFNNEQYKKLANSIWKNTNASMVKGQFNEINDLILDEQFISDLARGAHTYTITNRLKGLDYTSLAYLKLDKAELI